MDVRTIQLNGIVYLRVEDAVELLRDLGATEPTDTRTRIDELADNLSALKGEDLV